MSTSGNLICRDLFVISTLIPKFVFLTILPQSLPKMEHAKWHVYSKKEKKKKKQMGMKNNIWKIMIEITI